MQCDKRPTMSGFEVFQVGAPDSVIGFIYKDDNGWRWELRMYPGGDQEDSKRMKKHFKH